MKRPHIARREIYVTATLAFCGLTSAGLCGGEVFESLNVDLLSQVPLNGFASNPATASDCWGYVSPSGREYALIALRNAMAVVEITDPVNPVIIEEISHNATLWGDVKVYLDHAYVVNDGGGGGMDVVDLSDVDDGTVTLVQRLTIGGLAVSHNIAIDTTSGFLYTCGSNLNGGRLVAYDLADPDNPVVVGQMSSAQGVGIHDAQVVTYTTGPYAGKQIAFCAAAGTGLDIYDVTDKSNMFRLSRSVYPNLGICHQCWLSPDRQYLYVNDEGDGVNETVIFDVTDLSSPSLVSTYTAGATSIDHNLYVMDGFVYEADYTAGVRIFCADDAVNPAQVGWFDTHPEGDNASFNGAWSCYPYFPSGTLIVSDENRGLFVLDPSAALVSGSLSFTYPNGRPDTLNPSGGTTVRIETAGICSGIAAPGTGTLHYDDGSGLVSVAMNSVSDNVYDAVFGAVECGRDVSWYITAETAAGTTFFSPSGAPTAPYTATAMTGLTLTFSDDFEADLGWTSTNAGAADGDWERGVPIDDPGWAYDPSSDSDGSGQCWLTNNTPGDSDVDPGGFVILTSPPLDMSTPNLMLSYDYFTRLTNPTGGDGILVQITSDVDAPQWFSMISHDTDGGLDWHHQSFTPDQLAAIGVTLTANTMVRFIGNDQNPNSVVELGIDAFQIHELTCDDIPGDLDGDGIVGINDFLLLLAAWGPCPDPCPPSCAADLDGDCSVGITDFLMLLANWS